MHISKSITSADLVFNPYIASLPPYNAGMALHVARGISGRDDLARLASNENAYGCSPKVASILASNTFEPWRYADPACAELKAVLGERLRAAVGNIVVGNGSEELIAAISRAVLVPGGTAVTVAPSFGLHEIEPLAAGAHVYKVPMTAKHGFDLLGIEAALRMRPQLLFLSSPWNPVGAGLDQASLTRLIAGTLPGTLFVLDEAYFEFAGADAPDCLAILRASGKPFIVLRTFSKAYGLAGLRVGYAVCSDPEIARVVSSAKPPFNVNGAAQAAALAALDDADWMHAAVARICEERDRVAVCVRELGFVVVPSQTNFLFIDLGRDSVGAAASFLAEGIIVKPWRETGYDRFIRVTIGLPAENDRFLAALPTMPSAR